MRRSPHHGVSALYTRDPLLTTHVKTQVRGLYMALGPHPTMLAPDLRLPPPELGEIFLLFLTYPICGVFVTTV